AMDVTYFAGYREDARGVTSRAIIKGTGNFHLQIIGIWPAMLIAWSRSPARCPLYPRKRTNKRRLDLSALLPEADTKVRCAWTPHDRTISPAPRRCGCHAPRHRRAP